MKRFLLILLLTFEMTLITNAQWVSPGDGTSFTFPDLVAATGGVVTNDGTVFTIHQDLTIAHNDVLIIDNQVTRIDAPGVLITINGTLNCHNTGDYVKLYGTQTQQFSMRFENATAQLHKLYLSDGAGIKVIESDITFDNVKFVYFTRDYCHAVIDILNCDPVINNCYFMLNQGAAISSPANGQASPQITNCKMDTNGDGVNTPQINLGPGGDDTIRIVNNEIYTIMASWYVGGISVADLMGVGDTKVLLKNNTVTDNRFGYNQQGQTISSVIIGNQFINNNHETDPMNGGSGISIYGTSTNNKAVLRNNVITGNLWGITAIYFHDIDLGTEDDWGNNEIHDNGNGGVIYDLYNNSTCDLMAVGNNWGTTHEEEVEEHIFHQVDDPSLGLVTFIPFIGYDQIEEPIDIQDIDLTHSTVYTITGQRVNYTESLKPGVYIITTQQNAKKIIIK